MYVLQSNTSNPENPKDQTSSFSGSVMDTGSRFNARKTHQLPLLPAEIIEDILLRLPVKSLLQFRSVSKSFCSLIDSKRFVKLHLENSTKNPTIVHHRVIYQSSLNRSCLRHCSLQRLLSEPITLPLPFDDPGFNSGTLVGIVGCCNGLICVQVGKIDFYFWNPSLRVVKKLPCIEANLSNCWLVGITKYGFGFDESTGDYKVYGVLFSAALNALKIVGKIYSLNANSWKTITNDDIDPHSGLGKFLNGKLHWGREFGGRLTPWDIDTLDLSSEEYGVVPPPTNVELTSFTSIGVLEGSICMLFEYPGIRMDVWILKQYEVHESWSKMVTVSHPFYGSRAITLSFVYYMGQHREILLRVGSNFMIYSLEGNEIRFPAMADDHIRGPQVYVESLVSLVADDEEGRQA